MEFGDSVSEAPEVTARTVQPLHAAEAETKVRMVHLDRDGAQAKAVVPRIKDDPNSDATADRGRSPLKRVARRRATRPSCSSSRCVAEAGAVPAPDGGQRRLFRDGSAAVLASRLGVTWTSAGSAAEGPEGQPTQASGASPGRTSWPTPSRSARRQDLLTRTRLAPLRPRAGSDRPRQRGTTAPGSPDPNGVHGPHRIT